MLSEDTRREYALARMRAALEPVSVTRTAGQVLREIVNSLRVSGVERGDRLLGIDELTAALQVSRSVVREATDILQQSGVIDVRRGQGGGVFMGSIASIPHALLAIGESAPSALPELMEFRAVLQQMACLLAAERATPQGIELMQASVRRMSSRQPDELMEVGAQFFSIVGHISANPWLESSLHNVIDRSSIITLHAMEQSKLPVELVDEAIGLVKSLSEAISANDPAAIIEINALHIQFSTEVLTRLHETITPS